MPSAPIGLLLNKDRCAYSYALGEALERTATGTDLSLRYLPVEWAQSSEEVQEADIERLLERAEGLSGMLMMSSVFSHGLKSLAKFTQRWWPRPASSIGYRLPLIPSVVVDNRAAMQAATNHLIREHDRKDILFVRGRADSQEANDRYFGFRQALLENHLISSATRVLQGDFTKDGAIAALAKLPRDSTFDAVIAANDEMALGVLSELERMKIGVPDDVVVMGFDDVPAAASARIPLSTMAQPFEALATNALSTITKQVAAMSVAPLIAVPAELVCRASCGCAAPRARTHPRRPVTGTTSSLPAARIERSR